MWQHYIMLTVLNAVMSQARLWPLLLVCCDPVPIAVMLVINRVMNVGAFVSCRWAYSRRRLQMLEPQQWIHQTLLPKLEQPVWAAVALGSVATKKTALITLQVWACNERLHAHATCAGLHAP